MASGRLLPVRFHVNYAADSSDITPGMAYPTRGNAWHQCVNRGDRHFTNARDFAPGSDILIGGQRDRHFASIKGQAFHCRSNARHSG